MRHLALRTLHQLAVAHILLQSPHCLHSSVSAPHKTVCGTQTYHAVQLLVGSISLALWGFGWRHGLPMPQQCSMFAYIIAQLDSIQYYSTRSMTAQLAVTALQLWQTLPHVPYDQNRPHTSAGTERYMQLAAGPSNSKHLRSSSLRGRPAEHLMAPQLNWHRRHVMIQGAGPGTAHHSNTNLADTAVRA